MPTCRIITLFGIKELKNYEKQLLAKLQASGWELDTILPADEKWMACKYWKIISRKERYGFSL